MDVSQNGLFTEARQRIVEILNSCGIKDIDDQITEYITTILLSIDPSTCFPPDMLYESVYPILLSCGAISTGEEVSGVCRVIVKQCSDILDKIEETRKNRSVHYLRKTSIEQLNSIDEEKRKKLQQLQSGVNVFMMKNNYESEKVSVRASVQRRREKLRKEHEAMETASQPTISSSSASTTNSIQISGITISFGSTVLIENADLNLTYGRVYGLIGSNGAGKSTLLSSIHANEYHIPENIRIHYLRQETPCGNESVLDVVINSNEERNRMLEKERVLIKLQDLLERTEGAEADENLMHELLVVKQSYKRLYPEAGSPTLNMLDDQLDELYEAMEMADIHNAEARASKILAGLQFTTQMMRKRTKDLSGGWRMRVSLASALFSDPDLLLLDEPDNHLDLHAVIWLEDYLVSLRKKAKTMVIIVSHDSDLLETVCTDTILLKHKTLKQFSGSYATFLKVYNAQLANQQREAAKYQAKREHIQSFIDRFRVNANRAAQVQSRIKALNKMVEILPVQDEKHLHFGDVIEAADPSTISGPLTELRDVSFAYTKNIQVAPFKLENINMCIEYGQKIALVGPNGAGKSTLINILCGALEPLSGYAIRPLKLRFSVFHQHHIDAFDRFSTPLSVISSRFPGEADRDYRTQLAKFGIDQEMCSRPIYTLSGGQRSRLAFAMLSFHNAPHMLLLDEPSNHLDIETRQELAMLISSFAGSVVLVSHDATLIRCACDELWVVEEGKVQKFKGDFDNYRDRLREKQFRT